MILRRTSRRAAFTLLEMTVVLWGLGVCLLVGVALIVTALKASRAGEVISNRIAARSELAMQFRADVAAAETAPDKLGDTAASPACLILARPGGSSVVYKWQDGTLERIERTSDRELRRRVPVGAAGTGIEFLRPAGGVVIVRITEPPSPAGVSRRSEVSAALGGNLR